MSLAWVYQELRAIRERAEAGDVEEQIQAVADRLRREEKSARNRRRAPDGSRFVVAVYDHGELTTEVFLDGPELQTDEDVAGALMTAAKSYVSAPEYPESRRS